MYRVGNQLLASARFPLDKNRGIRGRNPFNLLEHRFESRAVADHLLELALVRRLLTTTESLESSHENLLARGPNRFGSTLQSRSYAVEQDLIVKRLGQKLHCTRSERLHSHFCVTMCGDEDGRNSAVFGVQLGLQFEPRHPRHADIGDQTCGFMLLAGFEKVFG